MGFADLARSLQRNNRRLQERNKFSVKLQSPPTKTQQEQVAELLAQHKRLKAKKKINSSAGGIIPEPRTNILSTVSLLGFIISTIYLIIYLYAG